MPKKNLGEPLVAAWGLGASRPLHLLCSVQPRRPRGAGPLPSSLPPSHLHVHPHLHSHLFSPPLIHSQIYTFINLWRNSITYQKTHLTVPCILAVGLAIGSSFGLVAGCGVDFNFTVQVSKSGCRVARAARPP